MPDPAAHAQQPVKAFVHIVESPSPEDHFDGRTEGRMLCEMLRLAGIPGWYRVACNRNYFIKAMQEEVEAGIAVHKSYPIFHISAHGNTRGVGLTDGDLITWNELKQILAPWQSRMKGGLFLSLSTCMGSFGTLMAADQLSPVPFWKAVTNRSEVGWTDAAVGFSAFYHRLFKGAGLEEAVEAMKVASGNNDFTLTDGLKLQATWGEIIRAITKELDEKGLLSTPPITEPKP